MPSTVETVLRRVELCGTRGVVQQVRESGHPSGAFLLRGLISGSLADMHGGVVFLVHAPFEVSIFNNFLVFLIIVVQLACSYVFV